jgi:hypothetical protein
MKVILMHNLHMHKSGPCSGQFYTHHTWKMKNEHKLRCFQTLNIIKWIIECKNVKGWKFASNFDLLVHAHNFFGLK